MSKRRPARFLLPLAVLALLLGAVPALRVAEAVDVKAAWEDLDQLKKSTKSKATNEDLDQYMDAVFAAFKGLDAPPAPPEDAGEDEKKQHAKDMAKFEKEQESYRKAALKLFLKILTLTKVDRNENNIRSDMNTKAARILGQLGAFLDEKAEESLAKKIQKAIEKDLTNVKTHEVSTDLLEAAFEALGKLNCHDSLEWMLKEYTHAKDNEKIYLVAAHKAMVLFKNVPGKLRYEVVDTFVTSYAGVEAQAEQSSNDPKVQAKKRFWDDIKTGVIPVVQYYSRDSEGNPAADAEGKALAKMSEFQAWLRDHKSLRKPPWVDPKG